MDASEYQRRYDLVRQWCARGYQYLRKTLRCYGIADLKELPEHPRFTEILTKAFDELLQRNWKWYFVLKLRSRGIPDQVIVTELYDLLWVFWISRFRELNISYEDFMTKSPDIFWRENNKGGERDDELE